MGLGGHKDAALGPTLCHGRQGKSVPGHSASSDRDWLGKGAGDLEMTALLGGAPVREDPQEQLAPPATSSAGLVWEQCIGRQLVV